jgi:hypothetical protein
MVMASQWHKLKSGTGIAVIVVVFLGLGTAIALTTGSLPTRTQSNSNAASVQGPPNLAYPVPGTPLPTVTLPAALPYPPPGATSTPIPPDTPYNVRSSADGPAWDQDTLTKRSSAIIYGTIIQVQPARWSTPNGQRPKNPFDPNNTAFIYTPVKIRVIELLKGNLQQEILIDISGGTVGQDSAKVMSEDRYTFKEGQQVILYLPDGATYLNGAIHNFYDRYTITADGQAQNENRKVPLLQLLDSIRVAVRKP